jgi:hypothetical protein
MGERSINCIVILFESTARRGTMQLERQGGMYRAMSIPSKHRIQPFSHH